MADLSMVAPHGGNASALTAATVESVLLGGDLSKLTPAQRVAYYTRTCESLGLNPLTKPFDYIALNGKLVLYARKDAADQLRRRHVISIDKPDISFQDDWIIVSVLARDANGRTDADTGVVNRKDMRGDFGNALMKAVTKAKRRVTLSICGLGMLDETEVETIPTARAVSVDTATGEIAAVVELRATPREPGDEPPDQGPETSERRPALGPAANGSVISPAQRKRLFAIAKSHGWPEEAMRVELEAMGYAHSGDIKVAHYDDIVSAFQADYEPPTLTGGAA